MTKNKVELIGYYGGDKRSCISAWQSTTEELGIELPASIPDRVDAIFEAIAKTKKKSPWELLEFLASEGHHTPMEKGILDFQITGDIASHIHALKHRISAINSECLEASTLISFENINGGISQKIPIEELYKKFHNGRPHQNSPKDADYSQKRVKGMRLRVLNEDTKLFETSHIKDIWKTAIKKIFKVTLRNGNFILCSENHPLYTNDGYKSINTNLSIGDLVGCNGVSINVETKPWTFKDFFCGSENYTRQDFANLKGIKLELCKKWGYIFDASFKKHDPKEPWNKGKGGYKMNIGDRKHNPLRGSESHFWRGGITSDRASIGVWTTKISRKVHEKYDFTCQNCGVNKSDLEAHHIIPVVQDENKARDFDNLITLCHDCHKHVHSSIVTEQQFASEVLQRQVILSYDKRLNKKISSARHIHYSDVVSIEFIKEEECYDIEVEGKWKNFVANSIVTHNSARYKEFVADRFYIPEDWAGLTLQEDFLEDNGEIGYESGQYWSDVLKHESERHFKLYHQAVKDISKPLGRKRAKESARYFLGYNTQLNFDWQMNFRSFVNIQKLRNSPHAQREIKAIANTMLYLIENIPDKPFQYTLKAFGLESTDEDNLLL